jgi:hypothetical protein
VGATVEGETIERERVISRAEAFYGFILKRNASLGSSCDGKTFDLLGSCMKTCLRESHVKKLKMTNYFKFESGFGKLFLRLICMKLFYRRILWTKSKIFKCIEHTN